MSFEIRLADGQGPRACVAEIAGDVDTTVVPELRGALEDALDGGCRNVILDLKRVTYADSSALSLLVWLDQRLRPIEGRMVLAGANRDVSRILELSGFVQVAASVATSPNVSAALEGLDLPEEAQDPIWLERVRMPAKVEALSTAREEVSSLVSRSWARGGSVVRHQSRPRRSAGQRGAARIAARQGDRDRRGR